MPLLAFLPTPVANVFRTALRPALTWLLLLCLLRTLLPEAWLLAWHQHRHTTHELASAARPRGPGKLWLTTRHQHCHAEQFYNVPFVAAVCLAVPPPRVRPRYQPGRGPGRLLLLPTAAYSLPNRGPPA